MSTVGRYPFGADAATTAQKVIGSYYGPGTVAVTFWTAQTAGTQITDLLAADGVTPITSVTALADGSLPLFYGPVGTMVMWANGGGTELVKVYADPSLTVAAAQAAAIAASMPVLGIVRTPYVGLGVSAITIGSASTTRFYRALEGGTISKVRVAVGVQSGNICVALHANTGTGLNAAPNTVKASSGSVACPAAGVDDVSLGSSVTAVGGDWLSIGADNSTATFNGVTGATDGTLASGLAGVAAVYPATGTISGFAPGNNRLIEIIGVP